jgi:phosphoglycolate phosphatase
MTKLPKPQAVLFDWDGTMVNSLGSIYATYNRVRDHFGEPHFSEAEAHKIATIGTAKDSFTKLYPNDPEKVKTAIEVWYRHIPELREANLQFMPGIEAVVTSLHQAGVKMGIVTNMNHDYAMHEVNDVMKMGMYFPVIVGAGAAPRGKPSPDPIYVALEKLGLARTSASTVWFVGDMEPDQRAARAAGCPFILYDPAGKNGHFAPDHTVQDYADFEVMVKKILAA